MNSSQILAVRVAALAAILFSVHIDDVRADQARSVGLQPRWEYKIEHAHFHSGLDAKLNELGSQGWELVQIADGMAIFKRMQIPEQRARSGVQMELTEDPDIIIIRGKAEDVKKATDAIRRIEQQGSAPKSTVKDEAQDDTGLPILKETTDLSRKFAKYETLEKKELQKELRRLQDELLGAERTALQARRELSAADKAYQLAPSEKKADALLRMLEADAASRAPLERYRQDRQALDAARQAYLQLLLSEDLPSAQGAPLSEAVERGMRLDAIERQNRQLDAIERPNRRPDVIKRQDLPLEKIELEPIKRD